MASAQNDHQKYSTAEETSSADHDFYIVGIGASAGGLEALERTFDTMPADTGMAFVIVQHLSPDFKSLMDELLARHTKMPIHRVEDGMQVNPNSLYLIPPKQDMIIEGGRLRLTEKDTSQSLSLPIDHFFRSLAKDCRRRSIAIILSGTGSDGSRGICDVHEAGGLVIAQSVESSRFDGMPRSAIDTQLVDLIAPPSQIAEALCRYATHPIRSQLSQPPINESSMQHAFRLLQEQHQIDFNHYKLATISRRIERRIQLNQQADIEEYVKSLDSNPAEVDRLYRDLLIGVTSFFRDTSAYEALQRDILPELLQAEPEGEEFRVWVPACATGQEAYSIAIAIDETSRRLKHQRRVKIFATDVHKASIETAHAGLYPKTSLEDMPEQRLQRYFIETDMGYQVRPELREMIVFAPHNLTQDAPFTRLNLVTCRNLLIYLLSEVQERAIALFHFGLKTNGVLFLGASESPGNLTDEFLPLNERWKIYQKRRDIRLTTDFQGRVSNPMHWHPERKMVAPIPPQPSPTASDRQMLANYDALIEAYMPPGVLVNQDGSTLHIFGGASQYFTRRDGRPTTQLIDLAEGDLKRALSDGLQRADKLGEPVTYSNVFVELHSGPTRVDFQIRLLRNHDPNSPLLVTFGGTTTSKDQSGEHSDSAENIDQITINRIERLELELSGTKENLQATIEELETSNEELQATNEEMVASNEELQSTNEELHSVNEELYTVNAEYQHKIAELTELTNDVDNLLLSTEVHTLFLDSKLCVRKFTPKMGEVFNLLPHDIGRRIDAFTNSISCDNLTDFVSKVIEDEKRIEERVEDVNGRHFLMRILPYRVKDQTDGAVLTLIDISSLVQTQNLVASERERFERAIAANRDGTWDWMDVNKDIMWWSPNCYSLLGYEPDELPSTYSSWISLIHPEDQVKIQNSSVPGSETCYIELHQDFEYRMKHRSGEYRWFRHRAIVDHDEAGKTCRITGSVGDIHDRKCAEMANIDAIQRRDNFLSMLSHELRNPIGALLNAVQLSIADPAIADQEEMKVIDRQSRHMARLMDDLLDVARFGRNRIEFRKQASDLNDLTSQAIEAVSHLFSAKDQTLTVSTFDSPLMVFVDPARIIQAQVNLLTNASKYTPHKGSINYRVERDGESAIITIKDSGEGIPPDMMDHIFDLFVQSEMTLARSSGGMGVGLSLAKSIIEAHEGNIDVTSDGIGRGSTFVIRLPITSVSPSIDRDAPTTLPPACRVLLVEDNLDARAMLAKMLRLKGFDVVLADNGRETIEQIDDMQPDIAVIDIGLPEIDGYELAKLLRNLPQYRSMPLIALTGYGRESDRSKAIESGFDAHLVKPLNFSDLLEQITRLAPSQVPDQERGDTDQQVSNTP